MISNLMQDLVSREERCHGGVGHIQVFRAFDAKKHSAKVDFIDFVEVPDGSSIGRHKHGDNREWYVILQGQGTMLFRQQQLEVKPWDVLVNPPYGEHALYNNSGAPIQLIVVQFSGGEDGLG